MHSDKSRLKVSPGLIAGVIVFLFFGIALYLRIALPYDRIFTDEWIKFVGADSYYYMRIVDNLVFNFPHLSSYDPYMLYPVGMDIGAMPFYSYLLSSVIKLANFASPDEHVINVISAYFPAVLGALTVIPVFFIGKTVFNRWAGVLAAGLIAISPGEFLGRTILGFVDHHAIEVLLTSCTIMFLLLAIKKAEANNLDLNKFRQKDWAIITEQRLVCIGNYWKTTKNR